MKKLCFVTALPLAVLGLSVPIQANEPPGSDDAWMCVAPTPRTCSNMWVTCVGIHGGEPDPQGDPNLSYCDRKYNECLDGQCFPVY